ncbi:hypothetical protein GGR34_002470 [Microvirga flocculans]|uniref:Uncharacterized protein n=1 Tax=Microvirga flocculans TaxID=217168 RepID=A0A7W6IGN1_9HYPH|nr:hypothetical protein [Microvirga flocculans]MBB4040811.1 hypothetical protein [Microvirga flocculans]
MLRNLLHLVFRPSEQRHARSAHRPGVLPAEQASPDPQAPSSEFLAQVLGTALAIDRALKRQDEGMSKRFDRPMEPRLSSVGRHDGKIVPLRPRSRLTAQPAGLRPSTDDDPGPTAA